MVSSDREENCIRTSSHIKVLGVCQGFENVPGDFVVPFVHPKGFEEWERAEARELWDQATAAYAAYAALSAPPPILTPIVMFILIAILLILIITIAHIFNIM